MDTFKALVVDKDDQSVTYSIQSVDTSFLGEGNVCVQTHFSSVNYKDSLAVKQNGGIIRAYPMIPGVDAAGIVVSSDVPEFKPGDAVFVSGFDFGVSHPGGFSEYFRVPHTWLSHIPESASMQEIMTIGTAGLTAGLSILALEQRGMKASDNPEILVTGATGGVGSMALQILKAAGYTCVDALSRKKDQESDRLRHIGARTIYTLDEIASTPGKALSTQKYKYIIDTVGGDTASSLMPHIAYDGAMTMCGQIGGAQFNTTVFPLILRAVTIIGIDAVYASQEKRQSVWNNLQSIWKFPVNQFTQTVPLDSISHVFESLQNGTHTGRSVISFVEE